MKDPSQPDTMPDEYIADLPNAHRTPPIDPNPEGKGVNPIDTSSMPRGEDDDQTTARQPGIQRPAGRTSTAGYDPPRAVSQR